MKCANWIQTPFMIHAHPSGVLNFDVIVSPWVHGVSRHCHLLPEWLNMSFYYRSPQYQWMISYSSNCQSLLTCWFLNIFLTQKISCPTGKNTRIRMYRVYFFWWKMEKTQVEVSSGGHHRGWWSNLFEAGRWLGQVQMGGMVKSIKKPDHFMTIEADVHSIPKFWFIESWPRTNVDFQWCVTWGAEEHTWEL